MSSQVFNNVNRKLRAFIKISRPIGWPVVVLLSILCMMTFQVALHNPAYPGGLQNPSLIGLAILAFFFTAAGGYAINDYVDRESDAIARPERPIPSNQITPLDALLFSAIMFILALVVALAINPFALGIVVFNTVFLIVYSGFIKKYSGFLSNITIGLVEGITIPIFAEVVLFQRVSIISLSFMGFILVGIGINVLKDVAGVEGDTMIGVSSLATKLGSRTAVRVGALFLVANAISLIVPYLAGVVTVAYLVPVALMGGIVFHVAYSLFKNTNAQDVRKLLKRYRTSLLVLFPTALTAGIFLLR